MASKKGSYTPMPAVPDDLDERYRVTLAVLSGMITLSEAARRLGLSRVQYQTIMHRGLHGLVDGLSRKLPGRPPKSEREQRLHDENEKLRRENEKLRKQAEAIEQMLGVASELVRHRLTANARQPRKKKTPTSGGGNDEDPRQQVHRLRSLRMRPTLVAALAGVSTATVRRWRATPGDPPTVVARTPAPEASAVTRVEQMVRELRGLIGAEALSHAVPGVSRRQAASIKHKAMTEMERQRRASVVRITVTAVGVVRGFDAMHIPTARGPYWLLGAGDARVPYRTSVRLAERYDRRAVLQAMEKDLEGNGAPLVWRMDRAKAHRTPEVRELLRAHGVLLLHGPPHHPCFYGQLERQNREHRAWLEALGLVLPEELPERCEQMRDALNERWPRRTLDWQTAGQVWRARMPIEEDRKVLSEEVADRAVRIERDMATPNIELAHRLAIEQALTLRGHLRSELGGWC
jgi:transposase InsO family protein